MLAELPELIWCVDPTSEEYSRPRLGQLLVSCIDGTCSCFYTDVWLVVNYVAGPLEGCLTHCTPSVHPYILCLLLVR